MIRPFTIACAVLAAGSGLFLYTKKHETTVLDQKITKVVQETQKVRAQTAMMRTEWALLNQPDRLNTLAARFLPDLHPMAPDQFIRMASLEARLPNPGSRPVPTDPRESLHEVVNRAATEAHLPLPAPPVVHPVAPVQHAPVIASVTPATPTPHVMTARAIPTHVAHPHADRIVHSPDMDLASARPVTPHVSATPRSDVTPTVRLVSYHGARPTPLVAAAWHTQPVHQVREASLTRVAEERPRPHHHASSALGNDEDALPPPVPLAN